MGYISQKVVGYIIYIYINIRKSCNLQLMDSLTLLLLERTAIGPQYKSLSKMHRNKSINQSKIINANGHLGTSIRW